MVLLDGEVGIHAAMPNHRPHGRQVDQLKEDIFQMLGVLHDVEIRHQSGTRTAERSFLLGRKPNVTQGFAILLDLRIVKRRAAKP